MNKFDNAKNPSKDDGADVAHFETGPLGISTVFVDLQDNRHC